MSCVHVFTSSHVLLAPRKWQCHHQRLCNVLKLLSCIPAELWRAPLKPATWGWMYWYIQHNGLQTQKDSFYQTQVRCHGSAELLRVLIKFFSSFFFGAVVKTRWMCPLKDMTWTEGGPWYNVAIKVRRRFLHLRPRRTRIILLTALRHNS